MIEESGESGIDCDWITVAGIFGGLHLDVPFRGFLFTGVVIRIFGADDLIDPGDWCGGGEMQLIPQDAALMGLFGCSGYGLSCVLEDGLVIGVNDP